MKEAAGRESFADMPASATLIVSNARDARKEELQPPGESATIRRSEDFARKGCMPIRFRCAYCNQLMGISRRKAGTIVRCPKCSGQVVVPNPDDQPADDHTPPPNEAGSRGAGKALEDLELDDLLAGAASETSAKQQGANKPPRPAPRPVTDPSPPPDFDSEPMAEVDVEPVEAVAGAPAGAPPALLPPGVVLLPRRLLLAVGVVLLLLVGLAFLIGFLLGKQTAVRDAAAVPHEEVAK